MKKIILLFISILTFSGCKNENQEKEAYEGTLISGKAHAGFIDKPIYLKYISNGSVITKVDTVSANEEFEFKVSEAEYPLKAFLTNDLTNYASKVSEANQLSSLLFFQFGSPTVPLQYGNPKDMKLFLLDRGRINIDIRDSIYSSNISNSPLNDDLNELHKGLAEVMARYNKFNSIDIFEVKDERLLDSLMTVSTQISHHKSQILDEFIALHTGSYSSAFAFNLKPYTQEGDLALFSKIDPEIRNSKLAEAGRDKLTRFVNTTNVSDTIENFTLQNENGEEVSLDNIKSKYTLLDFWASWCAPCRKENKGISEYYSNFNKNDFQIVGVSVDQDKDKWLGALKEDNIQWTSLIDSEHIINDRLGVVSYPTNFLLDSNNVVIDKNLNSEKLEERLIELLKENEKTHVAIE